MSTYSNILVRISAQKNENSSDIDNFNKLDLLDHNEKPKEKIVYRAYKNNKKVESWHLNKTEDEKLNVSIKALIRYIRPKIESTGIDRLEVIKDNKVIRNVSLENNEIKIQKVSQ